MNQMAGEIQRLPRPAKSKFVAPRTAEQYFAKPEQFQERWHRVVHVISKMRTGGFSLQRASREYQVDARTVTKWGGAALRKSTNGRYTAKATDRLLRVLNIPTPEGPREIAMRDSRQASQLAKYSDAVQRYVQTGDSSKIQKFSGQHVVDANGEQISLLTDLKQLDRLSSAGVLSFESLYARTT